MWIEMRSILSGRIHVRFIKGVTPEKLELHRSGARVQDVFPELSPEDREFVMTGITVAEWAEHMS